MEERICGTDLGTWLGDGDQETSVKLACGSIQLLIERSGELKSVAQCLVPDRRLSVEDKESGRRIDPTGDM